MEHNTYESATIEKLKKMRARIDLSLNKVGKAKNTYAARKILLRTATEIFQMNASVYIMARSISRKQNGVK